MTKGTTKEVAVAAEALLLDDWFDAIEDVVRARARGFIETMLEEELSEALSRPRYGRRKPGEDEAAPSVVGVRHGHRETHADGHVRQDADRRAARPVRPARTARRANGGSRSLPAYQRRTKRAADALIAGAYLAGTNTRRVRRALAALFGGAVGKDTVSRVWRKTKGDWDAWNARSLAEEPIVRLILDGTVGARAARQKGDVDLAAGGARRARRRPEGAAGDQEHGRRERGGLARFARRSRHARLANAGARHRRWRRRPGEGARGAVARSAGPTLHRAQASQPARPRARPAARGDLGRLHRHDLRRDTPGNRGQAQGLHCANGGSNAEPSPTAWRKRAIELFTFTRFPPSQWKSIRTTNAIERLHEEFKRRIKTQTVLPSAETAAMLFWALAGLRADHHAQGRRLAEPRRETSPIRSLTSLHDPITSSRPETRHPIPTQIATGPSAGSTENSRSGGRRSSSGVAALRQRRDGFD